MTIDTTAGQRLRAAFAANFANGLEVGSAVSVWQHGQEVVSLCDGWRDAAKTIPWTPDTLVLVWSATKGPSSACVLRALEESNLDLAACIASFWPEFGRNGKQAITVGEVLSHRAGLAALHDKTASFLDHGSVVSAIENQQASAEAGRGHGYGPRTFGFIADEIVRRLSGQTLGEFWRIKFTEPMGLDFWIGLPAGEHGRVAQMLPARSLRDDDFARAMATPGSLTRDAFTFPSGALSPAAMNTPVMRLAGFPSLGGIGSARGLAKFYAMLAAGGEWEGVRYFSSKALEWMSTTLTQGEDETVCTETAFSAGFMTDPLEKSLHAGEMQALKKSELFGPTLSAFGHPGAGGSLAFADPENGIGFAYVMNQMEPGVLPKGRGLGLVRALYNLL